MKQFRTALMTAAVLVAGAAASGASAATIDVTSVGTGNGNDGSTNATIGGTSYWTTPILMTFAPPPTITAYQQAGVPQTSLSQTWVVFCDDLFHEVGVGGSNYTYTLGQVTGYYTAGDVFTAIAAVTSNQMGQLANIGRYDFNHGDEAGAIAAQTGIWALEYGAYGTTAAEVAANPNAYFSSSLSNTVVQQLDGLKVGTQYAAGLIPSNGYDQQAQILGSVPEPSTWAMMLVGIGGLGLTLRGARRKSNMAVAAA